VDVGDDEAAEAAFDSSQAAKIAELEAELAAARSGSDVTTPAAPPSFGDVAGTGASSQPGTGGTTIG
jgi:hypothetical protein